MNAVNSRGFVKLQRGWPTEALFRDPKAMVLLTVIAYRARYTDEPGMDGLEFGEAMIGDYEECGLTRKEYRCALRRLVKRGLVSVRAVAGLGTIAKLLDGRVFSLRDERNLSKKGHERGHVISEENLNLGATSEAIEGPPRGHARATNQKDSKEEGQNQTGASAPMLSKAFLPGGDANGHHVPLAFESAEFLGAWTGWQDYRRERKLPVLKPRAAKAQQQFLATLGEPAAIEAINLSIRNNWAGLFPPRSSDRRQTGVSAHRSPSRFADSF